MSDEQALRATILRLTRERGPEKTVCPSEVARAAAAGEGGDWRALMDRTRSVAAALVREGRIEVTQKGAVVSIADARGPIRLRMVP